MAHYYSSSALILLSVLFFEAVFATRIPTGIQQLAHYNKENGTTWAVLVAGSNQYDNYRHQADVCHAYQVLRRGGLQKKNIVVFMYDDIAKNKLNPRPGVIINSPHGPNVYPGVPKDYTGEHVTAENLYAVLLGNKSAVKGGSGKVVDSKPNDRIFIFYADHGGPGVLSMPTGPFVYAVDLIHVLKKKHASRSYKEMVIYLEACESGSIFEGMLPKNMTIYATTASNAEEGSWATYCPGEDPSVPPEYQVCLGDLYSVSWIEDSESHNLKKETVERQYQRVKERTSQNKTYEQGSHVMEYGNKKIDSEKLYLYQGFNPNYKSHHPKKVGIKNGVVHQRDAHLLSMWHRYKKTEDNISKKEILKQLTETMKHKTHLEGSMKLISVLLHGPVKGPTMLKSVRAPGLPVVDDWDCLKSMVRLFETHCGSLTQYGMKHVRALANICNSGVSHSSMEEACKAACGAHDLGHWDPSIQGFHA